MAAAAEPEFGKTFCTQILGSTALLFDNHGSNDSSANSMNLTRSIEHSGCLRKNDWTTLLA